MRLHSNIAGSLEVGVQTLRANPLRTVLSILGVIMGVASLVAVLAIGDGVEAFAREQIANTTDLQALMVTPKTYDVIDDIRVARTDYPVFELSDAATIAERVRSTAQVALIVNGSARVTLDTGRPRAATVVATTSAASQLLRKPLAAGRFFTDAEVRDSQHVAVISNQFGRLIAPAGSLERAIGRTVKLEGSEFRVVGIASNESQRVALAAYVPVTTSRSAMASGAARGAPGIYVRARRVEDVPAVKKAVEEWLTVRAGKWQDRATVSGGDGLRLDQARQAVIIFKTVMGAFAGISLLVGGIGIMNVLLSGVVERTREIGIRKATGARNRDILVQFLSESVAITSVGAIIGVAIGLAGAFIVTAVIRSQTQAEVHAAFTLTTMLVATLVSVSIGIAFGTYPALRASRLSPIDAVRHE